MKGSEQLGIVRAELAPWARDEVGVPAEAGAADFRRTWFERLEKENWLPATQTQYALETLALRSAEDRRAVLGPGGGSFFWASEKKLREEVEAFAAEFFRQSPAQRTAEWRRLEERCRSFPTLAHRLHGLQPGLGVVVPQTGHDRALLDLAEHVGQLFTLRPEARSQRRRTPDDRLAQTLPQWREAAQRMQRMLPQLAGLEGALIESLATAKSRVGVRMPTTKAEFAAATRSTGAAADTSFSFGDQGRSVAAHKPQKKTPLRVILPVAFAVTILIVRVISLINKFDDMGTGSSRRNHSGPTFDTGPGGNGYVPRTSPGNTGMPGAPQLPYPQVPYPQAPYPQVPNTQPFVPRSPNAPQPNRGPSQPHGGYAPGPSRPSPGGPGPRFR